MTRDTKIFIVGTIVIGSLCFSAIILGIQQMIREEQDVEAIARIYTPQGCVRSKTVVSSVPGEYVLECGRDYKVVQF